MIHNSNFAKRNSELDSVFGALKNRYKRVIILFIGDNGGRVKGGIEDFAEPLCKKYAGIGLQPYTVAPKLSVLRHTDHLLDKDQEGYWILTDLGKEAYMVLSDCLSLKI